MPENRNFTFKAAILDMDGVITQTAALHARVWKELFDAFLKKRTGRDFQPLDIEWDYKTYIDGKPRYDGIRSFLRSRNLKVPEGQIDDLASLDTIYGLGRKKNELFLELLEKEGVQVYQDTVEMVKKWRQQKIRLAVISSSRNCEHIMKAAGLTELFDVRIDGIMLDWENLRGKPEPDIFLKACELLGSEVDQSLVVEDAISGVQAGRKGRFGLVVGVARDGEKSSLEEAGADIVVQELTELNSELSGENSGNVAEYLRHALENIEELLQALGDRKPALFLDYDGTLTPIVSNPEDAALSQEGRDNLAELSKKITVGVISGRDRKDIESRVGVDTMIYAGSHGFDITGPNGLEMQYEQGQKALPVLDEAEDHLRKELAHVQGARVERKKYAIAVHFRNVAEDKVKEVEKAVFEELDQHKELRKGTGKMIFELKPDLEWDKGRALDWLMEELDLNKDHLPVFIGDDITDEDVFTSIRGKGIGIIVGSHDQRTAATYRLDDTDQVFLFLDKLKQHLSKGKT